MARRLKGGLFAQYLASHLLMLVIPLALLSALIYGTAVSDYRSEIEDSFSYKLALFQRTVDDAIREMNNVASLIGFNPDLEPNVVSSSVLAQRRAIRAIASYQTQSALFTDLLVYYRDGSTAITPAGIVSVDTLTTEVYSFAGGDAERFVLNAEETMRPFVYPAETAVINNLTDTEVIVYMHPVPLPILRPIATVVFVVPTSIFSHQLAAILGAVPGTITVSDETGRTILSVESPESPGSEGQVAAFRTTSPDTGWSVTARLPVGTLYGRLAATRRVIFVVIISVGLFGVITAFMLSWRSYRPIRALGRAAREAADDPSAAQRNELDTIQLSVATLSGERRRLSRIVVEQEASLRDLLLHGMLVGIPAATERASRVFGRSASELASWRFVVFAVRDDDAASRETAIDDVFNAVEATQWGSGSLACVEVEHDGTFAVLYAVMDGDTRQAPCQSDSRAVVQRVLESLASSGIGRPAVGVGRCVDVPERIADSFLEASAALDRVRPEASNRVVDYEQLLLSFEPWQWYPQDEEVRLVQLIKQGRMDDAQSVVADVGDRFRVQLATSGDASLRFAAYDLLNSLVKVGQEVGVSELGISLDRLRRASSLDDLLDLASSIVEQACERVTTARRSRNSRLREAAVAFIDENRANPALSLEFVADELGISSSYLSRFFKEQTGETFSDYVSSIRLDEARRLLTTTMLSVKEIVSHVGYTDVPSFLRKFKRVEGTSPGKYRQGFPYRPLSPPVDLAAEDERAWSQSG